MGLNKDSLDQATEEALGSDARIAALPGMEGRTFGWLEASIYLGCTKGTLKVWVSKRKVPFTKVNRLTRFLKSDLDAWLERNSVPADEF